MSTSPAPRRFDRRLTFTEPYDFDAVLAFYATRAVPGVEHVTDTGYARTFGSADAPGWFAVSKSERAGELRFHGACVRTHEVDALIPRVRRMFDLDAKPAAMTRCFAKDPLLRAAARQHPGLRVPGAWDGFELTVRAILGQQITVAAARTQAARLVARFGTTLSTPLAPGLGALFPSAAAMCDANQHRLGMPQTRADTLATVARAVHDGRVHFAPTQTLDDFVASWVALRGIGDWTAQYIAMRALAHRDAFPAGDLILRRAANPTGPALSERALRERAEPWRPFRAYTVLHLWRMSSTLPRPPMKIGERKRKRS
jgi:AraC family transcriptional regulator, regulatory protein of adaptative response / DNA-3-methyladenine glycosylase II